MWQPIQKSALVLVTGAGLLLLAVFWRPTLHTQAAEDWLVRPARPRVGGEHKYSTALPEAALPAAALPAGVRQADAYAGPHGGYGSTTEACAACHRTHTALGQDLSRNWPEEAQCFACHTAGGSASSDLLSLFLSFPSSASAFYSHPVTAFSEVHTTPILEQAENLANRHVECADCHDPHTITATVQAAPLASGALTGASGVEPLYAGAGGAAGYAWLAQAQNEYQVCFKCHSGYTVLPGYIPDGWNGTQLVADGLPKLTNLDPVQAPDSRDLALEFNPAQASYHPVLALGRNPAIAAGSFVEGWAPDSYTYCSDCHATRMAGFDSAGPHAGQLHILKGKQPVRDGGCRRAGAPDRRGSVLQLPPGRDLPERRRPADQYQLPAQYAQPAPHACQQRRLLPVPRLAWLRAAPPAQPGYELERAEPGAAGAV